MSTSEPYVEFKPGDLIAAEVMNDMQGQIRQDIGAQSQAAVDAISQVPRAEDADKLEGQSMDELKQAIIDEALGAVAEHTGYMQVYKRLKLDEEAVIKHELKNYPVVDVYQLDYFLVVASEDGYVYPTWVNFYLYHSGENSIRYRPEGSNRSPVSVEVESTGGPAYRLPFRQLLHRYGVEYTDDSSVGEIETEFWGALFSDPNDLFHDDQHAHSPWFDRCCREERTVKSLKRKGDWDNLWVKVAPRKTINHLLANEEAGALSRMGPPSNVKVAHFDWNSLGLKLLAELTAPPIDPEQDLPDASDRAGILSFEEEYPEYRQELKVMVLLRA